jgi:acetyl esterase
MALDPEMARIVDLMGAGPYLDLAALPAAEALRIARPAPPVFSPVSDGLNVRDVTLGVEGGTIDLRCYSPKAGRATPLVVHLHGGGWVSGSLQQEDWRCQRVALGSGCTVVSVGYRLAPETRFPTSVEDCLQAWDWAASHASGLGADANRMAISGSSAGGHLAVVLMLALQARGSLLPSFQLMTYPALDPRLASDSYLEFAEGPFMTRARMAWYWEMYLGGADPAHPWLAVLTADLTGFPPALIQVAELDVLRDEAMLYAERLRAAGVPARTSCHLAMIHGFIAVAPDHPQSAKALDEACAMLRAHFE